MDSCTACQFVYADVDADALPGRLTGFERRYREQLLPSRRPAGWDAVLRRRPAADTWSALEYTCHLRDVFLVLRDRLYIGLIEDKPDFAPMYRDQRVTLARYNDQQPEEALAQLAMAAQLIAQGFAVLNAEQLARLCIYNFPTTSERSLLWMGRHAVHEGEHHLRDITAVLARVQTGRCSAR